MTERVRLHARRKDLLYRRALLMKAVRGWFEAHGFLEVDTPLFVPSPGLETHLRALHAADGFLITSPEYQMKRLLAAGFERIFTVCKCFRAGEQGKQHNTEFTMLEWYRGHAGLSDMMTDTESLVGTCAAAVGSELDVTVPWERVTVRSLMVDNANVDVVGDESAQTLLTKVIAAGIDVGNATAWDDVFFCAFVDRVEPVLAARAEPLFVTEWPIPLAALARARPDNPAVSERFEAYLGGIELANAFGELTDADEQRRRLKKDAAARAARGFEVYPNDDKFLAALEQGIPDSGGIALGIDRLMMALCDVASIRDVLAFASDEL